MIKLSIVIPCYERDGYLLETIKSALKSKSDEVEIIVLDNNSKNINIDVIAKSFPEVRFIKNSENIGLFGNWNRAFEVANGEFVYILGDDDLIEPEFVYSFFYYLEKYPLIDLYYSDFYFIDSNGNDLGYKSFRCPWGLTDKDEVIKYTLSSGFGLPTISMIYKKLLFEFKGFEEEHMGSNDWEYLYGEMPWRLAYGNNRKLVKYRKDGTGASVIFSSICDISIFYIYKNLSCKNGPLFRKFFSMSSDAYWRLRFKGNLPKNKYLDYFRLFVENNFLYRCLHRTAFFFIFFKIKGLFNRVKKWC